MNQRSARTQTCPSRQRQRGLSLIEMMLALTVASVIMAMMGGLINSHIYQVKDQTAASQFRTFLNGAKAYVQANWIDLYATSGSGIRVTTANMINQGYLPTNFSPLNVYNQSYELIIRRVTGAHDAVEAMAFAHDSTQLTPRVTTDRIARLAATIGPEAGFIMGPDHPGACADCARGAYGGWEHPMAAFRALPIGGGQVPPVGSNALAAGIYFQEDQAQSQFLHRYPATGDGNVMHTNITMDGSNQILLADGDLTLTNGDFGLNSGNITLDNGSVLLDNGSLTVTAGNATIGGEVRVPSIDNLARIEPATYLSIGGADVPPHGVIATDSKISVNDVFLASKGRYLTQLLGETHIWVMRGMGTVRNGNHITKPDCHDRYGLNNGTAKIQLFQAGLTLIQPHPSAGWPPPPTGWLYAAKDKGTYWEIQIENYAGTTTDHWARVIFYCDYQS